MGYSPSTDRAAVLHAHPIYFITSALLLARLLSHLSLRPHNTGAAVDGYLPASMIDDLAAWGDEFTDLEDGGDTEDNNDQEGVCL